ncbi:hypothetical protein SDC9_175723 [bioreactor metagenome]|uniref:Iron-binding zinc finger CDGSH type domain-containing protein n=1 Tax=bioreactor metagenome TaxID=1076179 RepID=A0A645GQS9_9ZZZZ
MRVQENPADIGRCGCGRREYCDGSHGLSEAQWQELRPGNWPKKPRGSGPPASRKTPAATKGPTTASEKRLAPSVVRPPWASSRAWNSRTTKPIGAIAAGPNRMAPSPTPVGCDELPVSDGSFRAERMKEKAAATPSSMRSSGCSRSRRLTEWMP